MDKISTCQCRKKRRLCKFNPWVGKLPWRRKWQLTPVCLPGKAYGAFVEPCGLQSVGSQRVRHNSAAEHTSTGHGILQERILEWVAILFCRDLPNPVIKPRSPALQVNSLLSGLSGKPTVVFTVGWKKKVCISESAQFKSILFKGLQYIIFFFLVLIN